MKILKKVMFLAVAVFALALSSSCSSNDSYENRTEINYIKFKYKGTAYTFDSSYRSSLTLDVIGSGGVSGTYKQIALHMPLDPSVGSHPVVYDLSNMTTTYQASFTFMGVENTFNATSGTITITANSSERIEGTFSFSGTMDGQTVEVTDGEFSIEQY